ncbi:MAG: ABC transporter permease subunit [Acidimicrobiia bacterium]|nr:ABC transporter permease subunit [Acidimicrobiia bacterium]
MTEPASTGLAVDITERAPEPPPAGPWRWMRENLFSGHTWGQIAFNSLLTLVFALVLLNILRFITSYLFAPERKWAAVTHNAKLMMVQAFPQDDLIRIWTSLGIFIVLVVWSMASWKVGGRLELTTFAGGLRSGAVVVAVTAIMHHAAEARTFGIPILQVDSPADWSNVRAWILVAAVLAAVLAHFAVRWSRAAAPSPGIPTLTVPVMIMAAVAALLWTVELPVPLGQFDETTAPIAATTAGPWTILFALAVVAYPLGILIEGIWPRAFRRFLISAWVLSYPVIIFVIQRNPILDWSDIVMLIAVVLGAGALRVLVLLPRGPTATAVVAAIGLVTAALPFAAAEEPLWVAASLVLIGLAILTAALTVKEPVVMVRASAAGLALACLLIWFAPMPFPFRVLIIAFTLFLLVTPTFGVTKRGRANLVRAWIAASLLIVVAFRLGATFVDGLSLTTFLSSDVVSIILAVVLGGGALWVLSLPPGGLAATAVVAAIGLVTAALPFASAEEPLWLTASLVIVGLAILTAALTVKEPAEMVRASAAGLTLVCLLIWFAPMPFLYRTLIIAFTLFLLVTPTFGGTRRGRTNMVRAWTAASVLIVVAYRMGATNTSLEFQGTTFLGGFNLTILLAVSGIALSLPVGLILALARTSSMPIFRLLATGYIELVRSVPMITWLFFGSAMLTAFLPSGVEFDEIVRIVAAITIFNSAYVAENIRGGLQAIDRGQYEAARATGLSIVQSTSLVILPQAVRTVIPALVGSIIVAFKDTSLVAIIGLADILLIARSFIPQQSDPNFQGTLPQMMFFMALFYWVVTFTISKLSMRYERSLGIGER